MISKKQKSNGRRLLLIIAFTGTLFSCGNSSDILPKEKMEKVLWDVAQSGEFLNSYIYYRHPELNRAAVNNKMLDRIFTIHKITKKQFDKSLEYYRDHPKQLQEVMDSIVSKQQRLQADTSETPQPAMTLPAKPGTTPR